MFAVALYELSGQKSGDDTYVYVQELDVGEHQRTGEVSYVVGRTI